MELYNNGEETVVLRVRNFEGVMEQPRSGQLRSKKSNADQAVDQLAGLGRVLYSIAIAGFGVETIIFARSASHALGLRYDVVPVLPWLPTVPGLAYAFGVILVICAVELLFKLSSFRSATLLGGLLFFCAVALDAPKNAADIGNIGLRTIVFQPLAIAALAWLLPGSRSISQWLRQTACYVLAIALIVFGIDHFLALHFIANLIPGWIPWHSFWVAFFGTAFVAAGLSIGLHRFAQWGAISLGLMFAIWVFTLHLPRILGLYAVPGASTNPSEWCSLLIAVALWGGLWAMGHSKTSRARLDTQANAVL